MPVAGVLQPKADLLFCYYCEMLPTQEQHPMY